VTNLSLEQNKAGQGVPFFGGKELLELDPAGKKYLSIKQYGKRIQEQLQLKQNTVLVTCSGTIGKVALVPKHWEVGLQANMFCGLSLF
jgi:type I restriction enzyme, S subunit